ncbi:MAG: serine--tRNA ligase [Candidatus Thermoplasmatota archaeon]|nr:serine--tRNA ligase [Candidatus Thermoplasmatota archaeon]
MIDIELIRKTPDIVRESLRKRNMGESVLDEVIAADEGWRKTLTEINQMRKERNELAREIANSEDRERLILGTKEIAEGIAKKESDLKAIEEKRFSLLSRIPNIILPSVPYGKSDDDNVEIKRRGTVKALDFEPKDHVDIGLALDLFDIERAAKVSGARFFYLKGDAVFLELALVRYAFDALLKEGFVPVIPPVLTREFALFGTGFLPFGEENIYRIKGEDLCLVGTAEVPLGAMHSNEIFSHKELPKYYAGFSTCFRTEAGAHGKDTKGIFRVHQFDKIEMFKYCLPEESESEHEKLLQTAERIYQGLGIPYRVVEVCSGELGASAAKKYDIEAFLPGQKEYREVVSCSNCLDYQARRLMIRYRSKEGDIKFVHTLNSTAIAIERTMVAILENYQQGDGSVLVPKALQQFMGKERIDK